MTEQKKPIIIGFCGLLGSGKDTAAGVLIESYGFKRLSFASALKDAVASIFGWERRRLEGATPEDRMWREQPDLWWSKRLGKDITPRSMLQQIGTNCLREYIHDDLWIASVERQIEMAPANGRFVISDVRFPNEVKAIEQLGGILVRVQRGPLPPWWEAAANGEDHEALQTVHISESALASMQIQTVLHNDGSLDDFISKITMCMEEKLVQLVE